MDLVTNAGMAAGIVFAILIAFASMQILQFLWQVRRYTTSKKRKKVLYLGDHHLSIVGGELHFEFYDVFMPAFHRSGVKSMEIIFGPRLIIRRECYEAYLRGLERNNATPTSLEWLKCHPVLKYWYEYPDRLTLYLKMEPQSHEYHFSVGDNEKSRNVCVETPHGMGRPGGGFISQGNAYLYAKWREKFKELKNKPGYCVPFTLENANELFNRIDFEVQDGETQSTAA